MQISKMTDEPGVKDILTELVIETLKISQPERDPISFYIGDKNQAAISNAADQIKQLQKERADQGDA